MHFVKLDIEGSKHAVLAEGEAPFGNAQHISCEYHYASGLVAADLVRSSKSWRGPVLMCVLARHQASTVAHSDVR